MNIRKIEIDLTPDQAAAFVKIFEIFSHGYFSKDEAGQKAMCDSDMLSSPVHAGYIEWNTNGYHVKNAEDYCELEAYLNEDKIPGKDCCGD